MTPQDSTLPTPATDSFVTHLPVPPASNIETLDLSRLARGHVHRLRLKLVEDGLGFDVDAPLLVARGRKPGPVLMLTAALHGDEINGIPVMQHIIDRLDIARLHGTVIASLVCNVPSFNRHLRRYFDGEDLNRLMPGEPRGNASSQYAHRLFDKIVRHADFLIDLHTASRGRVNSLYARADMTDPMSARMAYLLRPQIIAHKPANDMTLRGHAMGEGIPSVTLEIGNPSQFQPEYIKSSYLGVRSVMCELGMVKKRNIAEGTPPILCDKTYWLYTEAGGLLTVKPRLCARLAQGAELATLRNIYGDTVQTYACPADAVVVGKSIDPVGFTGARIAHLGRVVEPGTAPFVSRTDVRLVAPDGEMLG